MIESESEPVKIVIIGHVDHGKSTLMGRLLADCGSLPDGKLEQIQRFCELNKKVFEYSFLLDALKDEQDQGITIEATRCHFKVHDRHYLMLDAPGHIEFLKNMLTGAAAAEAALLVIDAKEGIQENTRRHCYMVSFLGIKQIVVVINKMDLVNYRQETFLKLKGDFSKFLTAIRVSPLEFIPVSAKYGGNIALRSQEMPWYTGSTVLGMIESFGKVPPKNDKVLRFPVQDIYKFTERGDDPRIIVGTVETGTVRVGDEVIFLPSQKKSRIKTIEGFHQSPKTKIQAGHATGFTLTEELYLKPGELMCKTTDPLPEVGTLFRANVFWIGKNSMVQNRQYKIKIGTNKVAIYLKKINKVMDSSELTTPIMKRQIDRHDIADCLLQTLKPVAFDLEQDIVSTRRFVIIDNYWIAGGGIIIENIPESLPLPITQRTNQEFLWDKSSITSSMRIARLQQKPTFIVVTGSNYELQTRIAKTLEEKLFNMKYIAYYLGISKLKSSFSFDNHGGEENREENLRHLGELAHILTDAGLIFISNVLELDDHEIRLLKTLTEPPEIIVINIGVANFNSYPAALFLADTNNIEQALKQVREMLVERTIVLDFMI